MIPSSDTVIDPGTVMIKPFNAPIADITMPAPFSPYYFTLGTEMIWIEPLDNLEKFYCRILF